MRNTIAISIPAPQRAEVRSLKAAILGRDRSQPHYGRKFYHFLMGMVCFTLYAFVLTRAQALFALSFVGGLLIFFDVIRFRYPTINALSLKLFGHVMRREELKSVSGNSFFVVGVLIVTAFFPKSIALLAILYLAVGDPVAAIIGTNWGKHRLPFGKKSFEGSFANFLAAWIVTLAFGLFYLGAPVGNAALLALMGATASVISEGIPSRINDNFTIPVISALLLTLGLALIPVI